MSTGRSDEEVKLVFGAILLTSGVIQLSRMPHRSQHHAVVTCALTTVFGRRLLHWTVKAAGGHAAEPTAIQKAVASKPAAPAAPAKTVAPHVAKPMGPNVEMLKLTRMADLPAKFRRKPFSEEELATINVSLHVVCIRHPTIPFPPIPPPYPLNVVMGSQWLCNTRWKGVIEDLHMQRQTKREFVYTHSYT